MSTSAHPTTGSLASDERGAAAIEFAILAPVLVLACLATVDLGLALNQRMTIDAMVRAGVEPALADPGVDKVREIVKGAAGDGIIVAVNSSDGFEMGGSSLSVDVVRSCACPESMSTSVSCTGSTCAASAKPYVYYRITAAKYYDPIIIPRFPLRAAIQVEVK